MRTLDSNRANISVGPVGPMSVLQRACACGSHTTGGGECESCKKNEGGDTLRRRATNNELLDQAPPIVDEVLHSAGQSLDASTRAFFESRFDHDFSGVRVHADSHAAESARAVDAFAYTVGRDIVFGAGQYSPQTPSGRELLAHELTHVMQQRWIGDAPGHPSIGPVDDAYEQAADQHAQQAGPGTQAGNLGGSTAAALLQRQPAAPQDDSKKKPAGEKTVVTQPAPQKIPAPEVKAAQKADAAKPASAKPATPDKEKKGVEGAVSVGVETETKPEEGKLKTEVAGKYKIEVTIPITSRLEFGPLSFFKEIGVEGSAGLHSSTGPRSPLTSIELEAATKVISLDWEKVKAPLGLGMLDLGVSVSPKASLEYSPMENKGTGKLGFAAEAEGKYKRSEESPLFIKLNLGVEKTYDKEGNADFKWSPAVWKASAAIGLEF